MASEEKGQSAPQTCSSETRQVFKERDCRQGMRIVQENIQAMLNQLSERGFPARRLMNFARQRVWELSGVHYSDVTGKARPVIDPAAQRIIDRYIQRIMNEIKTQLPESNLDRLPGYLNHRLPEQEKTREEIAEEERERREWSRPETPILLPISTTKKRKLEEPPKKLKSVTKKHITAEAKPSPPKKHKKQKSASTKTSSTKERERKLTAKPKPLLVKKPKPHEASKRPSAPISPPASASMGLAARAPLPIATEEAQVKPQVQSAKPGRAQARWYEAYTQSTVPERTIEQEKWEEEEQERVKEEERLQQQEREKRERARALVSGNLLENILRGMQSDHTLRIYALFI